MPALRKCQCGKLFAVPSKHPEKLFCSKPCADEARRQTQLRNTSRAMPSRTALGKALNRKTKRQRQTCLCGCGKSFVPKSTLQKYYDPSHQYRAKRRRMANGERVGRDHVYLIDGPCIFCEPSRLSKAKVSGQKRCRECEAIYRAHEQVETVRDADEAAMLDRLYGPLNEHGIRTGGVAEQVRESRTHKQHPVGYPHQPAECYEFHDGVRRGRC